MSVAVYDLFLELVNVIKSNIQCTYYTMLTEIKNLKWTIFVCLSDTPYNINVSVLAIESNSLTNAAYCRDIRHSNNYVSVKTKA